jgi:FAD/FMN-containing dehydrogenase
MTTTLGNELVTRLRSLVRGTVATPGDKAYPALVSAFHQGFRHTPPVAVSPADAADVATVVKVALDAGVGISALGEGHGFHYGITESIVIKTRSLRSVVVDPAEQTARIGAGTTWQEVLDVSGPCGLVPLSGSDAGVGAVGYVLGGGLGPLGRTYGYGADSVLSFEVVTGAGELITVDDTQHPDLFWALRGGNHGLGIVVAMTVGLVPGHNIHGNAWYFEASDIERVLCAWVARNSDLPKNMNTYAYLIRMPNDPEAPDALRGNTLLEIIDVYVGEQDTGRSLSQPLLDLATPVLHEPGRVREDTLGPTIVSDGGVYLDDLNDEAISTILAMAGPQHTYDKVPLASVGFQLLGGALSAPQASPNAVTGRGAAYAFHIIGAEPELIDTEIPQQIQALHQAVAHVQCSGTIPNYIGPSNKSGAVDRAWRPDVRARLDQVREAYDPTGIFADPHTH